MKLVRMIYLRYPLCLRKERYREIDGCLLFTVPISVPFLHLAQLEGSFPPVALPSVGTNTVVRNKGQTEARRKTPCFPSFAAIINIEIWPPAQSTSRIESLTSTTPTAIATTKDPLVHIYFQSCWSREATKCSTSLLAVGWKS